MTTWRKELETVFSQYDDSFENVIDYSPKDSKWLDFYFDDYSKEIEGNSFTIWTKKRVYFPVSSNGQESVGSVSRYPDNNSTDHFGS